MNKNKIFFLFMAMLSLVLTACSSDDDYTWAPNEGSQVYFRNDLGTTVTVSKDASSVNIPINRANTEGSITVPLTVSGADTTVYNVPSTVTFADGEAEANIVVTYNPDDVVYGDYGTFTITIGDDSYKTSYGLSSHEFRLGAVEWGEWQAYNSTGTATYYYNEFFSGTDQQSLYYRQSSLDPTKYQFMMTHMYNDVTAIWDWDSSTNVATLQDMSTGYTESGYGEFQIDDWLHYWGEHRGNDMSAYTRSGAGYFDQENQIFYLHVAYYIPGTSDVSGCYGQGWDYVYIDGVSRADYSVSGSYVGRLSDEKNNPSRLYFNVQLGHDVTMANVAVVSGTEVDSTTMAAIEAGTYEPLQQITASGDVYFDATDYEDGDYTLVIVPIVNGDPVSAQTATVTFKYSKGSEVFTDIAAGTWTLGYADVSSVISSDGSAWGTMPAAFNIGDTYEQEGVLSQSSSDPTKFRITPYWYDDNPIEFTVQSDGSIVVDGVDTGIGVGSYGNLFVSDFGTIYSLSLEQAQNYGLASYVDGNTYYFTVGYLFSSGGWYAAETDKFVVSSTGAKAIKAAQKYAAAHSNKNLKVKKATTHKSRITKRIANIHPTLQTLR